MKLLVVGSKGFIGSHCWLFFKQNGFETYGCDVVVDYNAENYFCINPTNADYQQIFSHHYFDCCINCSGAASVPDSFKEPARDFFLNTVNVARLLEAVRTYTPNCKFINLSSAAVYGNPSKIPVSEFSEQSPISPYGVHKLFAEKLCEEYYHFFNINTCSLRIFSAYGPGLKKQLFWDLFQKSKNKNTIELFGTGEESRDFIYVDDINRAIKLIIEKGTFTGNVINLASGIETSIKEAVNFFYKELGWKGEYEFLGEERKGDPLRWNADIGILRSLGFKPSFTLNEGLRNYIEWLKIIGKE